MMINFSHVAEILGWRGSLLNDFAIPETFQEVYDKQWGGTYVALDSVSTYLVNREREIAEVIGNKEAIPNSVLSKQFLGNDPDKVLLLFTGRLNQICWWSGGQTALLNGPRAGAISSVRENLV